MSEITAARVLMPCGIWRGPSSVRIADGRIVSVSDGARPGDGTLTPGLIDLHNNGAFGIDFATAAPEQWRDALSRLANTGVTAVLPTVITAPLPAIQAAMGRIAAAMATLASHPLARVLGAHLEGPFLAPARRGAHCARWLLEPTADALDTLLDHPATRRVLRLVTLAPERLHAPEAVRRLIGAGIVVSAGHSDATAAEAIAAADGGVTMVTHLFNAMRPFSHRDPGLPGAALTDPRLWCCLIIDGQHVDPAACRLAFAAAGERLVAVTDSIAIAGLPAGTVLPFGGEPVVVDATGLGRRRDGTISGAGITLDEGVRRMIAAGIAAAAVLRAATEAPASAIGRRDLGRIEQGARADLVLWDENWVPRRVWIGGVEVKAARLLPLPCVTAAGRGGGATAMVGHSRTLTPPLIRPREREKNEANESHLDLLATESVRPGLDDLDQRGPGSIVHLVLEAERLAQSALANAAPALAQAAEAVAARMLTGGRLFYLGAGTPGRLAVLDAAELGPTYSVPPGLVMALLAGGPSAMTLAAEGAEDDPKAAVAALDSHGLTQNDAVVGIAASGRTPYVVGGLKHARACGALVVAIVNNPASPAAAAADIAVEILTGAELIAGSTRMTAGTTQKIALNALSTAVMVALGKTYGSRMVDVRATNDKLRRRAVRMVCEISGARPDAAVAALAAAGGRVKPAVVALMTGVDVAAADELLVQSGGRVRDALARCP